jgi:PST family polysaccharide transporter
VGLVAFVLIGPLISFLLGHWYLSRLPKLRSNPIALREMAHQWKTLLRLGVPFMGAGAMSLLVQLWIRVEVGNTLGAESLGHFQAAWAISMQYIGFVLGAMAADYFPRLTGVIHDHKAATRLVNEQTEIALLLSAPVFIAIVGLTPWVIQLLYTDAFLPAVEVLRWQILGDVLKVASWPLGFVLVAAGAGKTFFVTETIAVLILGGLIAGFTSSVGIKITGIAFFVSYAVLLPLLFWLARRRIGFVWTGSVVKLISVIFVVCAGVAIICTLYWWGAFVAVVLALAFGVYTLGRLANISNVAGRVGKINFLTQKWSKLIGIKK